MRRVLEPETVRKVCLYKSAARTLSPPAEAFAEHLAGWLPRWHAMDSELGKNKSGLHVLR